jgi:hypothetical protein
MRPPLQEPFIRSGQISGRGQYLQVVITTGGSLQTVPHTLGRVPQMLICLDAGNNPNPAFIWPTANRTKTSLGLNVPNAGTYLFWLN